MSKKFSFFCVLVCFLSVATFAQHPPFWDEIAGFQHMDSVTPPPAHPIVFTGSSSFRKWTGVRDAFPGYPIINRGFGGSTFPDVIRYADEVIFKYHPRQIVLYCGDNDLASSDTVTAQVVFRRFTQLFRLIRSKLPQTAILYVSIKPSPSREKLMPRMVEANKLISGFISRQKHATFADVYHKMLAPDGKPIEDIFEEDKLHMNAKGYEIWQKILLPYLVK
ncbi:MAG: G-D-S-L family lipolytic protein [Sphingobacteriales bacterium 50-39]|nr:G-D-S-L family lipolytic protein [Sphingobacteriales bacterium]OJW54259.1 MAG: G-D-S-L family lipolytic protein [Sphingobacteriales bacterium 50-39]